MTQLQKRFALAAALVMLWALCASAFSGGTGTSSDPYIIASAGGLNSMRGGTAYYKLSDDIQMSGYAYWSWRPVDFGGYFDGNGKNIYVDIRPYFSDTPALLINYGRALFGNVSGTITNLRVEGKVSGYHAAGIVQNLTSGGTLSNCVFSGTVTSRTMSENEYFAETLDVLLEYLVDNYNDELTSDAATFERTYIGGLYAGGLVCRMSNGTIDGCRFSGTIESEAADNNFSSGGIAALMYGGSITNCSVNGDSSITGFSSTALSGAIMSAGGIAGYTNTPLTSRIYSCTFEGEVESTYYAGGIAGEVHGTRPESNTVNPASLITASYSAGGIVGCLTSGGKAEYNTVSSGASVSAEQKSAGGIVGLLDTESMAGATVSNNTSHAVISGEAGSKGGIVGSVGSNTYIDTAIGGGNTYSGASVGIGSDRNGQATNGKTVPAASLSYSITAEKLDDASYGTAYPAHTFKTNANASLTVTWELSGSLPSGMSFADGILSGTPTEIGTFTFKLKATIDSTETPEQAFTLTVNPSFTITLPAEANKDKEIEVTAGENINLTFTGPSGSTLTVSGLPPELGNTSGASPLTITGIMTVPGSYAFEVTGEYSGQTSTTGTLTLIVHPAITITTTVLEPGSGTAYSEYTSDIEFSPNSTASITGGNLNMWLTDNPEWLSIRKVTENGKWLGRLAGTPTESGDYSLTVNISLNVRTIEFSASRDYDLYIAPSIDIVTTALPPAYLNEDYEAVIMSHSSAEWSIISGRPPLGLSWTTDSEGRMSITGKATKSGDSQTFTVQAKSGSLIATRTFTIEVIDTTSSFKITTDETLPEGTAGTEYSCILATDLPPSSAVTWTYSGSFPVGMSLSSAGVLSGTPARAGTYNFTVYAETSSGFVSKTLTLVVAGIKALRITTSSADVPSGIVGTAYSFTFGTDWGSPSAVTWTYTGSLPSGLSLSSSGTLSGTPAAVGKYSFKLYASVSSSTDSMDVSINVASADTLSIPADEQPSSGTVGTEYSFTLWTNSSSTSSVTWTYAGSLPPGLSMSSSGTISGTPTLKGTYSFTAYASDGLSTANKTMSITIADSSELSIVNASTLPSGRAGVSYDCMLVSSSTASSQTWQLYSGNFPSGLSLNPATGRISGVPEEAGTYTFGIALTAGGKTVTQTFNLTINSALSFITKTLPQARAGETYSQTIALSTTSSSVVWTLIGSLPSGLSFSSGTISGTPAAAGDYAFSVMAVLGDLKAVQDFTLSVTSGLVITTSTLPAAKTGSAYSVTLQSTSEASSDVWYIDSGDVPQGLTLGRDTGILSGTPELAGSYTFRVRLASGTKAASKTYTLEVSSSLAITTLSLPNAKAGTAYTCTLTANSGDVSWSEAGGELPAGITLSSSGKLSGTPELAGEYSFTVQAEAGGLKALRDLSLTVKPVLSITTSSDLPSVKLGAAYSVTLETDAGQSQSVYWYMTGGALPPGIDYNSSTGTISGTPTAEGTFRFTMQAAAGSLIAGKEFSLTVEPMLAILNESPLASGKVSSFYTCTFITDSEQPTAWTLSGDSLPSGMTFTAGVLSGTPAEEGTFIFTLTASSKGLTSSKEFVLFIGPALTITTTSPLPSVKAGCSYSFTFETDAGSDKVAFWGVTGGTLPSGLTLHRTAGTLSGTPTAERTYSFTVQAVVGSLEAAKEFTLTVRPAISITTDEVLPRAKTNAEYSLALATDAAEDEAVTWALAGGSLPEGFALDGDTSIISGWSSAEGTYSFTILASTSRLRATKDFVLTVGNEMMITTGSRLSTVEAGSEVSITLKTDENTYTPASWSVVSGSIPPGLTLNQSTGTLPGRPQKAGTYKFTVQGVSGYSVAQKEFTIKVEFVITSSTNLPNARAGEEYTYIFTSNGADDAVWSVSSEDKLPAGLSMSPDGVFSGTTTETGTYKFMVYAFVSNDVSAMKSVQLTVDTYSALPITTASLPSGKVGQEYYAELLSPVEDAVWSREGGTLPPGLTLSSKGLISGVPEEAGTFWFVVRAAVLTREGVRQLSITIAPAVESRDADGNTSGDVSASGGGGGCDSGLGVLGLAVVLLKRRKR